MWESVKTGLAFQSFKTGILHMWTCTGQLVHMYSEIAAASLCVFLSVGAFDYYQFYQVICKIKWNWDSLLFCRYKSGLPTQEVAVKLV